jgi:5'-methylthioadenosine phosphorylase
LKDYSITSPELLLKHFKRKVPVPEIIVIASKGVTKRLAESTNASEVVWAFDPLYVGKVQAEKVGLVAQATGASATAFLVEHLIACGAKMILFSTALGAFQPYMKPGDFVIPSKVVIGEGTSRYYYPGIRVIRPDMEMVKTLKEACSRIGVKPFVGSIWNTDAFYREMRSQIEKLQARGVLGVEMESSATFTVAKFRGIRAASLLTVSDTESDFKWKLYFLNDEYLKSHLETSCKVILEALKLFVQDASAQRS